jgi:hypothetical protein
LGDRSWPNRDDHRFRAIINPTDAQETLVHNDPDTEIESHERGARGFLSSLLLGLVRDAVKLVIAFGVGTGAAAIACWYYGIPLGFSLLGGILVLGLALALSTDSLFS